MKKDLTPAMTHARFRELCEAYGGSVAGWPLEDRKGAEQLVGEWPEARILLAREAELDTLLRDARPLAVSSSLSRNVAEIPLRSTKPRAPRWALWDVRKVVAMMATSLTMGALAGAFAPWVDSSESDAGWEELSSLALGVDVGPGESP